jgi:hypothetical protein
MSLSEAKAAANAMVQGAVGDYEISNPIAHLNGLTARIDLGNSSEIRIGLDCLPPLEKAT